MIRIFVLLVICLVVAGCSPSPAAVQKAISETQTAYPTATTTQTPVPTETPTPIPKPTNTPTDSLPAIRQKIFQEIHDLLENVPGVQIVRPVTGIEGVLYIEVLTIWDYEDDQPGVSWDLINALGVIAQNDERSLLTLTGGEGGFLVDLTTYSAWMAWEYHSTTDYYTLQKIYTKKITYEEWVNLSGAGFVE